MRQAGWRSPGECDWGLGPVGPLAECAEAVAALRAAARYAMFGGLDGMRLRRRARRGPLRLSLGCGRSTPSGWCGLDLKRRNAHIHYGDLRRRLPLPDQSVEAILAEHSMEHLFLDDVVRLVEECYRVMKPGGVIRVVAPDALFLARMLLDPEEPEVLEQIRIDREIHRTAIDDNSHWMVANRMSHQWGHHRSLLSGPLMTSILRSAGFQNVVKTAPEETTYFDNPPGTHAERFPGPQYEAFAVEAHRAERDL